MVLDNIDQDLISYYRMGESTGSNRLDVVGSDNLTNVNSASRVTGKIGNGTGFVRASNQELTNASAFLFDGTSSFTFAVWHKMVAASPSVGGAIEVVIGRWDSPSNRQMLLFADVTLDQYRWVISDDGTAFLEARPAFVIASSAFRLLIAEYNSVTNELTLRIDEGGGSKVATAAGPASIFQSTDEFRVGSLDPGIGLADATMDEIAVWSRLLTSTEKSELYNSGNGVNLFNFLTEEESSVGGYLLAVNPPPVSGIIGGYADSRGFLGPTVSIGGYVQSEITTVGPTGFIGGYAQSRGFLVPDGNIGGFVFAKSTEQNQLFAILGGYLNVSGTTVGPASFGGFALSIPITSEDPRFIGGAASGLFQVQESVGGYSFGQPDFTNFVATRGRTIVIATSEDVIGQNLNLDAQIIFKQVAAGNFNAKLDNIKTSQGDVIAAVQVEKFQLPPTVFIQSVELIPASGETGPLNTLSPDGARQVCVTASGFLNDGDEFVSAHIDFADPFTNQPGTAIKPFLSVSGFTGQPPWVACHDYDMSGIYKITARAQDNRGMVGMDLSGIALTSGLTAGIHYPTVDISGTPRFGEVPPSMQVNFTLVSSGLMSPPFTSKESNDSLVQSPTDDRILWQFGNRERSSKKNPFTFYQSPGLFAPKVMYKFNHPSGFGRIMVSDSLLIGFVR